MARRRRGGRAIAATGVATGAIFFAGQLLAGERAFAALMKGALVALAVMAAGGVAQSLWHGDRVEEAEAGGVRLRFGSTRRAVDELDRLVRTTIDESDRRFRALERKVFNDERD